MQLYNTAGNHIAVIDGGFLLLVHRSHFRIIVKAASSECKENKQTGSSQHFLAHIAVLVSRAGAFETV